MGFRFRKRVRILPGVYINLNTNMFKRKGGPSLTLRSKLFGANISKEGVDGFANTNGTGFHYRTKKYPFAGKFISAVKWVMIVVAIAMIFI